MRTPVQGDDAIGVAIVVDQHHLSRGLKNLKSTLKVDAWHTFQESSGNRVEVLRARWVTVLVIEEAGLLRRPGQVRNLVRRILDGTSCRCRLTRDADVLRAIVRTGLEA